MLTAEQLEQVTRLPSLPRRRRRRHAVPHAAGDHPKGAYFTRGSGHNRFGGYTEDADEYTDVVDRIARKIQKRGARLPAPIVTTQPGAKLGLVTVGGCHAACIEALDLLAPRASRSTTCASAAFRSATRSARSSKRTTSTSSSSRTATRSCAACCTLETGVPLEKLESVRYYGGFPMSAHHVIAGVKAKLEKAA